MPRFQEKWLKGGHMWLVRTTTIATPRSPSSDGMNAASAFLAGDALAAMATCRPASSPSLEPSRVYLGRRSSFSCAALSMGGRKGGRGGAHWWRREVELPLVCLARPSAPLVAWGKRLHARLAWARTNRDASATRRHTQVRSRHRSGLPSFCRIQSGAPARVSAARRGASRLPAVSGRVKRWTV